METTLDVLGIFAPKTAAGIEAALALAEGDAGDVVKNITNMELLKKYTAGTLKIPSAVLCGFLDYYETKEQLQSKKDDTVSAGMVPWFYTVEKYTVDRVEHYISADINDYKVIRGVKEWNEEGCSAFVYGFEGDSDIDIEEEILKKLEQNDSELKADNATKTQDAELNAGVLSQEEWDALNCMIYGVNDPANPTKYNSVLEIDGELFLKCVGIIDNVLGDVTYDTKGFRTYWQDMLEEIGSNEKTKN